MELDRNLVQKALVVATASAALGVAVALLQTGPAPAPLRSTSPSTLSDGSSAPQVSDELSAPQVSDDLSAPQVESELATDASSLAFLAQAVPGEAPQPEVRTDAVPVSSRSEAPTVASAPAPSVMAAGGVPPNAEALVQQLASAERLLHMGHLRAVMDFGNQVQSSTEVSFELADEHDASMAPRLRALVTYSGSDGPRQVEHVIIGDQSWRRQPDGQWTGETDQETVAAQVQVYLPHAGQARDAQLADAAQPGLVHWFDPVRGGVVQVELDPQLGVPRRLRWAATEGGPTLTVTYGGWNNPVSIPDPTAEGMPAE